MKKSEKKKKKKKVRNGGKKSRNIPFHVACQHLYCFCNNIKNAIEFDVPVYSIHVYTYVNIS